jgi:hypothetical protein
MTEQTAEQEYFCNECHYAGKVSFPEDAAVVEVLYALLADHKLNQPGCLGSYRSFRIRNAELCSPEEWAFIVQGEAA